MLKLKSISPSRIKTFEMCKFKYWLTYNTDLELKTNWGACHGSLVHDVLEQYSNGQDPDWVARLYRGYGGVLKTLDRYQQPEVMESPLVWAKEKDYANKRPLCDTCPYASKEQNVCTISQKPLDALPGCPRDLFDGSIKMCETQIEKYKDRWDKTLRDPQGEVVGYEYGYRINIPGTDVPIIGYMDLVIEEDPDTIHVIDYKTGTWTQDYLQCREDIQVKMYSLASRREFIDDISGKGYNYKNVILTFDYFTKNPITVAFTEEEDLATEEWVKNKVEEIESTAWIDRIVRDNSDFEKRWAWKCRSLCDTGVCSSQWKGKFKTE